MVTATCPDCDHVQERPTDTTAELRCIICGIMFALPILPQEKLKKAPQTVDDPPTIKPTKKDTKADKSDSVFGLASGESDDNKPSKTPRKATFDESQNEPRSKKKAAGSRKRRDTSDDDAVRRGSRGLNASGMRLMIGLIVGLLFLGTVGAGGWFLFGKGKTPTVTTAPPNNVPANLRKNDPFADPLQNPPEMEPIVRPPEKVIAITPTLAIDGAEVKLPGTVDRVCYGGGGRFVIFRIPSVKQLAVLDLSLGKVAKYISLAEDGALFAAGMNKLYVYSPIAAIFQRYDLVTFEKEATVLNPLGGSPKQILMGHATDGPLYVGGPGVVNHRCIGFLDGRTFKAIDIKLADYACPGINESCPATVRVSGDGRVYSWWHPQLPTSRFNSFVIDNTEGKHYDLTTINGPILPGPDGTLFTVTGVFSPEQKKLDNTKAYFLYTNLPHIPAAHGCVYINVFNERQEDVTLNRLALKMIGNDRPLVPLNNLKGLEHTAFTNNIQPGAWAGVPLYDRVYLVPNANVLAVLATTGDKVYLNAFGLKANLEKSGTDYLIVASQSPSATLDQPYRYVPEVLSKKGEVKLKLESGPDGMKIDGNAIVWDVPKSHPKTAIVILTVSDKSGQETFHTFTISVSEN